MADVAGLEEVRARVLALETNSRRLRAHNRLIKGTALLALAVGVLLLMGKPATRGQAQEKQEKKERVIETGALVLRDKAGSLRAFFGAGPEGAHMELYDEKVAFRGSMTFTGGKSALVFRKGSAPADVLLIGLPRATSFLCEAAGKGSVGLTHEHLFGSTNLQFLDGRGQTCVNLSHDVFGSELAVFDARASKRLSLSRDSDSPRVRLVNEKNKVVALLPETAEKAADTIEAVHRALVPPDAGGFLTFDAERLANSKFGKQMHKSVGDAALVDLAFAPFLEPAVLGQVGEISRGSAFLTRGGEMVAVWTTRKPYNRAALLQKLAGQVVQGIFRGQPYFVLGKARGSLPAFHLMDDRTLLQGTTTSIPETLARLPAVWTTGPLSRAWTDVTSKSPVGMGVHLPAVAQPWNVYLAAGLPDAEWEKLLKDSQKLAGKKSFPAVMIFTLWGAQTMTARVDFDAGLAVHLDGVFSSKERATAALRAWKRLQTYVRDELTRLPKKLLEDPSQRRLVRILKQVEAALPNMRFQQNEATISVSLPFAADKLHEDFFDELTATVLEFARTVRAAAQQTQSQNNLKQMALAMLNYEAVYRRFPPAALEKGGKPLLSWRVLILPYLDQVGLYNQFKLDEPWDSPHNIKLLPRMPPMYSINDPKAKPGTTVYQVFVGKGTAFEPGVKLNSIGITDGTSNTLLIVEARDAVPWTKPADLPFDPDKKLPALGGHFKGIFQAALADGSVKVFPTSFPEKLLKVWIQRNCGKPRTDPQTLKKD